MTTIKILRRTSRGRDYLGSLYVRVIHERRVSTLTLPIRLYGNEWDSRNECVSYQGSDTYRQRELTMVSTQLRQVREQFSDILNKLESSGVYHSRDLIRLYRWRSNKKSLWNFTERLYEELSERGQVRTARAYRTVSRGLIDFSSAPELHLSELTSGLIKRFETHLKNLGRAANTISYYMRNLRAIYHRAIDSGLLRGDTDHPFHGVYTGVQVTRKRALSREGIRRLYKLDPGAACADKEECSKLLDAQRLFFFSFHARGMSFVDMAYLRKNNIRSGVLSYFRKKTGQLIEIKVTAYMQSILNYFSQSNKNSVYVFPIIRDGGGSERLQYESGLRGQNKRLQRLALLAGLKEHVSTHVARHSWATMAKRENLPLWVISEGLGHSNEKTTYTYLASFERSVLDLAGERISTLLAGQRGYNCH